MRTECIDQTVFGFLPGKPIQARFDGGRLTSDGGLLLLAEADRRFRLTESLAGELVDLRDQTKIKLTYSEMLRQRIFGIAAGYEDGNDHDTLRADPVIKVVAGRLPWRRSECATHVRIARHLFPSTSQGWLGRQGGLGGMPQFALCTKSTILKGGCRSRGNHHPHNRYATRSPPGTQQPAPPHCPKKGVQSTTS